MRERERGAIGSTHRFVRVPKLSFINYEMRDCEVENIGSTHRGVSLMLLIPLCGSLDIG